jgi:polyhydroxyalkanoate synthesis regulator phasin
MVIDDVRRTMEAALGKLTPDKARALAGSVMTGEGREQISKAAHDLVEWSNRNRERLTELVRAEVRAQLKQMGLATRDEVDALRKRVRELERSGGAAKRASSTRRTSTVKQSGAARDAATPAGRASRAASGRASD